MDLRTQQRTAVLLMRMSGKRDGAIECIPYRPQKVSFSSRGESGGFLLHCTPEEQGVSSALLAEFIREAGGRKDLNVHHISVIKGGYVIAEANIYPYEKGMWHVTHSLAKSIACLGVGMLVDEGRLSVDDSVISFFPEEASRVSSVLKRDLTVYHLLTMTSGVSLNEAGAVTERNWVRAFLNSGLSFKPGTDFKYNSMNTYMLSAIVTKITGETLFGYMKRKMFDPMEIRKIQWESCPRGITKAGWGIYMLPEDLEKICQMILDKGVWKGERIVSEEWLDEATRYKTRSDKNMSDYGYGYQIWMSKRKGAFQFNGMLGQNAYIFPDIGMAIVANAGNSDLSPKSNMTSIVEKYFGDDFRPSGALAKNEAAQKQLGIVIGNLESPTKSMSGVVPEECAKLDGSVYEVEGKNALLMPIFIQAMQNNHSKGISRIAFKNADGKFYMYLTEGEDTYAIHVEFDGYSKTELVINGEPYIVKTHGEFATDEDDNPVLKIDMPFIETANVRRIKMFFIGDRMRVQLSEVPGLNMAANGVSVIINTDGKGGGMMYNIMNKAAALDPDYIAYRAARTLSPVVYAKKIE